MISISIMVSQHQTTSSARARVFRQSSTCRHLTTHIRLTYPPDIYEFPLCESILHEKENIVHVRGLIRETLSRQIDIAVIIWNMYSMYEWIRISFALYHLIYMIIPCLTRKRKVLYPKSIVYFYARAIHLQFKFFFSLFHECVLFAFVIISLYT